MAYRQDWVQLIRALAPKYGVDPQAALAVASREGLGGGVGDSGTSYGPFQLHVGGALPRGRGRGWAESRAGIDYALGQIGEVARGQHGQRAVNSIVRRFERPADPDSEVAGALGVLGQFGGGPGVAPAASPPGGQAATAAPETQGIPFRAGAQLLAQHYGQAVGEGSYSSVKLAKFIGQQTNPTIVKSSHVHGPNVPATPAAAGIVGIASQQLGQPYVWGGESRKEGGFDCSGLVDWSMRQQGYQGPRLTTYNIAKLGQSVKGHPLQPGDLVLANGGEHVVIYAGHGQVIAAPHRGTVVQRQPLSKFHIYDVRRV